MRERLDPLPGGEKYQKSNSDSDPQITSYTDTMKLGALALVLVVVFVAQVAAFRPTARRTLSSRETRVGMARGEPKVIDPNETEEGMYGAARGCEQV